jgi:predicted DCC family thiol-disulfide oxidoreductase YuxK
MFIYATMWLRDIDLWPLVSRALWHPTFFFGVLALPVATPRLLTVLAGFWQLSLLLTAVGLFTRVSALCSFALGFYLLGLPHNFGKVNHNDAIVVIGLAIFAVSRCGDAWSLDRAWRSGDLAPSAEYGWPVRLYQLMLTLVLFAAAVAKVRYSGMTWFLSDNLANTILAHRYTHLPPTNLGLILAAQPVLCRVAAGAALVLEFSSPLLLVRSLPWRMLLLGAIVSMMLGFGLMLGVLFVEYITLLLIFFLPWRWLGARMRSTEPMVLVLYDGSCGLCRRTMAVIRAVDVLGYVRIFDVRADWPQLEGFGLDQSACLQIMHALKKGRVFTGFYAYRLLAWHLPLCWPVLPLMYLPGVAFVGEKLYAYIAQRRYQSGCPLPGGTDKLES